MALVSSRCLVVLLVPFALLATSVVQARIVFTEIMYNPAQGKEYEFVEIHNTGEAPVDLQGWKLTDAAAYVFPAGAVIPPGGYVVACRSTEAIRRAYPDLPEEIIFGDYLGSLASEGELIGIESPAALEREELVYDDDSPWDFLADGFGASLERVCLSEAAASPLNWRASALPASEDEFGGSPGSAGEPEVCPPPIPVRPPVLLSEIMYHPVLEKALEDYHEFVEIYNAGADVIDLDGWRLVGGIDFTFPPGAVISPGEYRVIAKNRARLADVAKYSLSVDTLLGDYERSLDNGGDKVALVTAGGQGVDSVSYDDDAPWPVGADALGAGSSWLASELLPLEDHRYMGRSLERVRFDVPAGEIANWAPSPLDGATPGRANASARAVLLPVAAEVRAEGGAGRDALIRAGEEVRVQVLFSPAAPAGPVEIEYFVDNVISGNNDPPTALSMFDDGLGGGDLFPSDGIYTAALPGQDDNTIVRYRIRADLGEGMTAVSPRPSDPNEWNAYFVSPVIDTETRVYQVFISPQNWARMWTNVQGGRVRGCQESPTWDAHVPAVFVHNGRVYDVHVRYQGSRWNRTNGVAISNWPYPRPSSGPLIALSWRIGMPRYNQLEGKKALILNKLTQGCPGYNAGVGYRLFEQADLPGCQTRFIRFHVNGGYYRYMIELERAGDEMMQRYHREMAQKHPELPKEKVGHLFKSKGCNCDEGPFGWGDERPLLPGCGLAKEVRYQATYERKTNKWDSHEEFIRMIEDLNTARRGGVQAMRDYLEQYYDMDLLLNYVAIINWSVPFDDMFQNHYLYQRLSDGKWFVFPWDLDQNFGQWKGYNASLYMGQSGDADNRSGWWNYLKDTVLRSYRTEYEDRLLLLNNTVLQPDNVARLVDEVTAQSDPQEAARAASAVSCSFPGRAASFKTFAIQRHNLINTQLAGVKLDAGPDQTAFAGSAVQFDASASTPDESPDATYTWDNGMTGEQPTFVFEEAGTYVVTLTVTVRNIPFEDDVTITILPLPERAFRESGGQVVFEAEGFFMNEVNGATKSWWEADSASAGFSGTAYMEAKDTSRQTFLTAYAGVAPELRYAVLFETPGTYRVWIRALSTDRDADSCYVGLDGQARSRTLYQNFTVDEASYLWSGDTRRSGPQELVVADPGLHSFSVWVRESGQIIDKIILTTDGEFVPEGAGPAESPQSPLGGKPMFVRGDADGDSKINITDAITILRHLFQGGSMPCEDYGDVDDTGNVDITDAIVLLNSLFQGGPPPAAPFPTAGYDPTADSYDCGDP